MNNYSTVSLLGNIALADNVVTSVDLEDVSSRLSDYIALSGADNVGPISISSGLSVDEDVLLKSNLSAICNINASQTIKAEDSIYAVKHGLIGKDIDFSEGGNETFAVGHEHHFFGKESFIAGNEANVVGAKGFYWKAIDTTEHKIYLTKNRQSRYPGYETADSGSDKQWYYSDHSYDRPYFGPKNGSALSSGEDSLFTAEDGIDLSGVDGKYITIWNCKYTEYMRCFRAVNVISGSIVQYEDLGTINVNDYHTYFRDKTRAPSKPYTDNQYVIFFPDMDQTKISCDQGSYVTSTTFGAAAIGEQNVSLGYNSFTAGFANRAEGHYSMSFGCQNRAQGHNTFAAGDNATVRSNYSFGWSGGSTYIVSGDIRAGSFNINPVLGLSGFYIGQDNFIQCVLSAVQSMTNDQKTALKNALGLS